MKNSKIDRIIQIIRENMAVGAGGFTSAADPKGPTAGFDPVMKKPVKRYAYLGPNSRQRWKKKNED